MAWQKTMAWLLSANWRDETLRVELAARVGDEARGPLMPAYTPDGPVILPPDAVLRSRPHRRAARQNPAADARRRGPGAPGRSARR